MAPVTGVGISDQKVRSRGG